MLFNRTAALWLAMSVTGPAVLHAQIPLSPGCGCSGGQPPVFAPLAPFGLRVPPLPGMGPPPPALMPMGGLNPCGPAPCGPPPCDVMPAMPIMPAMPMMETTLRPVYETRMRPENVTTYENVARTEMRREAMQVNVPVTTQRQVTVDEGGYQMVWVPKPVTKTIAETAYRTETRYREVPYQIVQSVPRTITRMVPEQTVRYVPQSRVVQGCNTCGTIAFAPGAMGTMPVGPLPIAAPVQAAPMTPATEAPSPVVPSPYEANKQPAATGAQTPAPTQSSDAAEWQTIRQRSASAEGGIEQQSYRVYSPQPAPTAQMPRRLFSPVPSAAAVWQAQYR